MNQLDYFYFGVRLGHFDRCEDALYFLKAFQQVFPGREVFNNLGYCHLQQARKLMDESAYTYWLPGILDVVTQAETLHANANRTLRSIAKPSRPAEEALKQAQNFFTLSTQADPYYLPAQLNLAVTWLYLGEIYQARAAIEAARKLAPEDVYVQGLRALILYEEGLETDNWSNAVSLLRDLSEPADAPLPIVYNTARLLTLRGRSEARSLWQRLANAAEQLPTPIKAIVCRQQNCSKAVKSDSPAKAWNLPIQPGAYLKRDVDAQTALKGWKTLGFDWQMNLYGQIYQHPKNKLSILEMSGYAEIVVLKTATETWADLQTRCGQALRASGKDLWSCRNWTAWVVDDEVREIWAVESFP
ncbi:MAG: tetratricopeptide repeat protein [Pseudomonadota bacterium]